jgi:hypothetical protein
VSGELPERRDEGDLHAHRDRDREREDPGAPAGPWAAGRLIRFGHRVTLKANRPPASENRIGSGIDSDLTFCSRSIDAPTGVISMNAGAAA